MPNEHKTPPTKNAWLVSLRKADRVALDSLAARIKEAEGTHVTYAAIIRRGLTALSRSLSAQKRP